MSAKKLPLSSILFVCSLNSIRSPMAEGLMKKYCGDAVYVQSCGLNKGELNEMMVSIMAEVGIDMRRHVARTIEDLTDKNYDLVIAFSDNIGAAMEVFFADSTTKIKVWPTPDPTAGALDARAMMDNFRSVRASIENKIRRKFVKE